MPSARLPACMDWLWPVSGVLAGYDYGACTQRQNVDFALKRLDMQSTSVVTLGRDQSSPPKPPQEKASAVEVASPAAPARVGEVGLDQELSAPLDDAAVPPGTEATSACPAPAAEAVNNVEAASTSAAPSGGCGRKRGRRSARQPKENAQPNQPAPKMARKSRKARCKQAQAPSDDFMPSSPSESDGDE